MPAFADDHTLVFDDGRGDLWAVDLAGGAPRRLTDLPGDQWRAVRGRRPGEILHMDPAGVMARDVTTNTVEPLGVSSFAFATGGGAIVYGADNVAELRRRAGRDDRPLVRMPDGYWYYAIAASADGRRLAITTHAQRSMPSVCLASLDDAGALRGPLDCLDRDDVIMGRAALSPDGETLYYQTEGGIRRRRLATGEDLLWLPGAYAYGGLDVSPDGRKLAYADTNPREIRVAPVDAPAHPVIAAPGSWAEATRDGRWVHVRWTSAGQHELVEQSPGGDRRVLVSGLGRMQFPTYDDTGQRIAFEVDGAQGGIWIVDVRGYPPERLTTRDGDSSPVWTGDGRVAFTRWDELKRPHLHVVDPARGTAGDADAPAHPLPRMTLARVPSTGEVLLTGHDHEQLLAWDPRTGRERTVPMDPALGVGASVPSFDGRWLAVLGQGGVWRVPFGRRAGARARERVWTPPPCATLDRPAWDGRGVMHVAYRPWAGDVHVVALD